jgi:hypothetical protein
MVMDTVSISDEAVLVTGTAVARSGFAGVLGVLKDAGYAAEVTRKDALPGDRVAFTVASGRQDASGR